jgi:exosortase E/protease (VPEID-CTERM system)
MPLPIPGVPSPVTRRWCLLVPLLIGEIVLWTIQFDFYPFQHNRTWMGAVFREGRWLGRWFIVAGLVTSVVMILALRVSMKRTPVSKALSPPSFLWVIAHLAAALSFGFLTSRVLDALLCEPGCPNLLLISWLALLGLTFAFWLIAGVPFELWPRVFHVGVPAAAIGTLAGAASCAAAMATDRLWRPLGGLTFWAARGLLGLFPVRVVCFPEEAILGTSEFRVIISPLCSGFEGMGLTLVLVGLILLLFRNELRFPNALLLIPLGIVAAWLLNVVRIAVLILIGTWGSQKVAVGGFHSQAGWLAFNAVGLGLLWIAHRWQFLRREVAPQTDPGSVSTAQTTAEPEAATAGPSPTLAYLAPMLAIVLASMVGEAMGDGAVRYYPLRVGAALLALHYAARSLDLRNLRPSRTLWGVAVGVLVFVIWMWLEPRTDAPSSAPVALRTPGGAFWLACRVIGSVLLVPVAEELAFRGYLMKRLIARDFEKVPVGRFTWFSFVVSSFLFGLLHSRWFAGTLAGMAYASVVYRTKRVGDAILAHAVTNGLIAAWVVANDTWSLW